MTRWKTLCALGISGVAALAMAQQPSNQSTQTTTTQTQVSPEGVTKTTTIEGKVVRYIPGRTIVLVGPDNRETTYALTDKVEAPSDVVIGRQVSLSTEPSENGQVLVTRITTQSVTPEGNLKTETETHSTNPSAMSSQESTTRETKVTTVTGTVSAFQPGKSITIVGPDKKMTVYTIDASSVVPSDVTVGSTTTIETTTSGGTVVRKITTTKTTKSTTVQPQ